MNRTHRFVLLVLSLLMSLPLVAHTEEEMAQERTIHTVVPRAWRQRECGAPHVARHLHILLVVEVQALELRVRCAEVDLKATRARCAGSIAHTAKDTRREGTNKGVFVVRLRVRDKSRPVRRAERRAHHARDAR